MMTSRKSLSICSALLLLLAVSQLHLASAARRARRVRQRHVPPPVASLDDLEATGAIAGVEHGEAPPKGWNWLALMRADHKVPIKARLEMLNSKHKAKARRNKEVPVGAFQQAAVNGTSFASVAEVQTAHTEPFWSFVSQSVGLSKQDWEAFLQSFKADFFKDFGEVKSAVLSQDLGYFAGHPVEAIGLLFCCFFLFHFVKIICLEYLWSEDFNTKRLGIQKNRQKFYHGTMHDMMTRLNALRQSSAYPAEFHFQVKHRELLSFLHTIAKKKSLYNTCDSLTDPFREFMALWLSVFEQCSISPETRPYQPCPAERFSRDASVAKIARTICREAMAAQPMLAGPTMNAANNLHRECTQGKQATASRKRKEWGPLVQPTCGLTISWKRREEANPYPLDIYIFCLRLTILAGSHVTLLLLFLGGILLATTLHATGLQFMAVCVDFALLLICATLYNEEAILENRRLDEEQQLLSQQKEQTDEYRRQLGHWQKQYDRVSYLWRYQTMHMLDLFQNCSKILDFDNATPRGHQDEVVAEELHMLTTKLRLVVNGMGSPSLYQDPDGENGFIRDAFWPDVNAHIERSVGIIREAADLQETEQVERHLDNFFGLIVVRILGAQKLPNTDAKMLFARSGDLTDAFVFVRLANVKREAAPVTAVVKDDLNPNWEEEFCLMVRDENYLTLEVFDENEDSWMAAPKTGIGFVRIHFRQTPGQWVKSKEKLRTLTYGKQMESTLEFEFFFANCIQHLPAMLAEQEEHYSSMQSIGAFLSTVPSKKELGDHVGVAESQAASPGIRGSSKESQPPTDMAKTKSSSRMQAPKLGNMRATQGAVP